jgi:hypothetical protein
VFILKHVVNEDNNTLKSDYNEKFERYFNHVLEQDGSFDYPFDSLKNVGKLKSSDNILRIFTWNLPLAGGYHKYFGFIQVNREGNISLFRLEDKRSEVKDQQNEILYPSKWYGALYYHIETTTGNGKTWYTLLGYDFNNLFTTKRVIEVVSITESGTPELGASIFNVRNQTLSRVIFEHSARVKMMLRYDNKMDMIVFDHLSPSRNDLAGNYQFYGPDFTYDGFRFEDGQWQYYSNIDLRNPPRETPPQPVTPPEENPEPDFLYRSNKELREKDKG